MLTIKYKARSTVEQYSQGGSEARLFGTHIVELQATVIGDLKSAHVKYPQRKDKHTEQLRNHTFNQGVSW